MNSGLYVHVPFCKSKCGYCDFNSYSGREDCIAPYFCALNQEIKIMSRRHPLSADTIYFGGGTPSLVEPKRIIETLENIRDQYSVAKTCEITMECNPGTIGFEGLKQLHNAGINRISMGLQSADNRLLKVLGRIHTLEDFKRCFDNARKAGFGNLSIDLMYGLPDQTITDWRNTLQRVAEFEPEHISCYSLKIEEGTPFASQKLDLPDDDAVADMYDMAVEYLAGRGYDRYEISNFAKPGKESRHNLKYWECCDFLGFGAGAYSCVDGVRFSNHTDIGKYINAIDTKHDARCFEEELSEFDKMSEFVFLGLRCKGGISETEFEKRFNKKIDQVFGDGIKKYTDLGFLLREKDKIRFSEKGFFVSNTILADFV